MKFTFCCVGDFILSVGVAGIGMSHNPSLRFLKPCNISSKFLNTCNVALSSRIWQPSSASCPSEIKDVSCRAGSMCAVVAVFDNFGILIFPVWVDCMFELSGRVTFILLFCTTFFNVDFDNGAT